MDHQIPAIDVSAVPSPLGEEVVVLDVREDVEWAYGHIEGAVHVPLMALPARLDDLPDRRLLVVCRVGARSAQAVAFLRAQGRDAVNLEGGMVDWVEAGRPIVSESGGPARVV